MAQLAPTSTIADGDFVRQDFLEEFAYRYKPGQHVIFFGPTGRGKTTLAGQMLGVAGMPKNDGLITVQIGPDKALAHLGKPTNSWPPAPVFFDAMLWDYKERGEKMIRRYQPLPKKPEHFLAIRRQTSKILRWMFGRNNWTVFIPDLQIVTDPGLMGLGKEVDQLILTTRKRASSVWMDAQAPRWIPRSSSDNTQHLVLWRNRDEDSVRRLARIVGIDYRMLISLFKDIDYHDAVWVDVTADEFYIVRSK